MVTRTRSRRRATARDLLYFAHPELWPHHPFLPVARRVGNGSPPQCGVHYDARGVSGLCGFGATVFIANLFALPQTEAELLSRPKWVYDTVEEMADDGWRLG